MKVAIKNKTELKYIDAEQIEINGVTLEKVHQEYTQAKRAYNALVKLLKDKIIVNPDKEYIIQIENQLKKINKLEIHEIPEHDKPIEYYKIEDGKLVLDKKKVGVLW